MIYLISVNKIGTTNADKFDEAREYDVLNYIHCERNVFQKRNVFQNETVEGSSKILFLLSF